MSGLVGLRQEGRQCLTFDYDTWLSTQPKPPIDVWDIDEDEDRAYDEWKDNVAMGYEQGKRKTKEEKKMTNNQIIEEKGDFLTNVF